MARINISYCWPPLSQSVYLRFSAVDQLVDGYDGKQGEQHDGCKQSNPGGKGERGIQTNCLKVPEIEMKSSLKVYHFSENTKIGEI